MPGEMLVLTNPKKRRKAHTSAKRKRTRTKRPRRARAVVTLAATSKPRRRRRSVRINPSRRRARRNPIGARGILSQLTGSILPAVQGAAGAIAVNVVYNRLPLPAMLKSGIAGTMTKAVLAIGLGMIASRFGGGALGKNMASGALTVLAYNQIQPLLPAGLGYYGAGYSLNDIPDSLRDIPDSLSEYISDTSTYDYDNVGEYISG